MFRSPRLDEVKTSLRTLRFGDPECQIERGLEIVARVELLLGNHVSPAVDGICSAGYDVNHAQRRLQSELHFGPMKQVVDVHRFFTHWLIFTYYDYDSAQRLRNSRRHVCSPDAAMTAPAAIRSL